MLLSKIITHRLKTLLKETVYVFDKYFKLNIEDISDSTLQPDYPINNIFHEKFSDISLLFYMHL